MSAVSAHRLGWAILRDLPLSARAQRLRDRFEARYRQLGRRLFAEDEDCRAYGQAILRAYRTTVGQPAPLRRARVLTEFASTFPVAPDPEDLLAGRQTFCPPHLAPDYPAEELRALGWADNGGHVVHDYAAMLRAGLGGLRRQCGALAGGEEALAAFRRFLARHAAACPDASRAAALRLLTDAPPRTFPQALQMVWLVQVFLHAENPSAAISFGRLDQYLWPFLREDWATGRLTLEAAFELICAFFLKCCAGDESQNLIVGGLDREGHDATNPLSLLLLAAMLRLRTFQPSLCVRVGPQTPPEFLEAAGELATAGDGQPGFLNDEMVVPALQAAGVSLPDARDYAVVGCYEAVPQGAAWANTTAGCLHLPDLLNACLTAPWAQNAPDFPAFLAGWQAHLRAAWAAELERLQHLWEAKRDQAPSPFGSLLMRGCLPRGRLMEAGGADYNLIGANLLGLGTLVDSLHVIRTMVYEQRCLSLGDLAAAVAADFPDESLRRRLLHLPGRYGTDSPATNELAAEQAEFLAQMVLDSRLTDGVRPYPGFFRFSGDIYGGDQASPDGRRAGDSLSYGVAPSTSVEASLTSALRSAAGLPHHLCACGNSFAVSLAASDLQGEAGRRRVGDLVQGYFALGGFHLHFNTVSPDDLRRAQRHPEQFAHLTVRVSGYSARFVQVDPRWQEALIERAGKGR